MTSAELKRWLEKQGCTFKTLKSGHLLVFRSESYTSALPMHGKQHELSKGLVQKIKKDLGLK